MPDHFRPRARLLKAGGSVEDVTDRVTGLQEYIDAWEHDVETPHLQHVVAWQGNDDQHPPGEGRSGYRVVYKTLRLVPYPPAVLRWPNLRIALFCGDVERGGIRFEQTITGRRPDQAVIPEYGRVLDSSSAPPVYLRCPNLNIQVAGWAETVQAVSALEVIWIAPTSHEEPLALLEAGRTAVSPLLALLEFEFGPRLLSTRLTEEVGEAFADWHWNRRIFTGTVYAESQAALIEQPAQDFVARTRPLIERNEALPDDERARLRLASRWYWAVQEETDPTLAFIQWWLIVETLEMAKTTKVQPVAVRLASLLNCGHVVVKEAVGRLWGLRSRLVHGEQLGVTTEEMHAVQVLARVLLSARTGTASQHDLDAARAVFIAA
jgi:hypothetical protein